MNNVILNEGVKPLIVIFIVAVVLDMFNFDILANIAYILTLFVIIIFRDTKTKNDSFKNEIVSPIDGKVIAIDIVDNKKLIYLKVSLLNNHKLVAPIDANMQIVHFKKGLNLPSYMYKAKKLNEQLTIKFNDIIM
jgi:phosphatidylserine decarboxylase